jgi:hypothetical protein
MLKSERAQKGPAAPPSLEQRALICDRECLSNLDAAIIHTLLETLPQNIAARRERVRFYCVFRSIRPAIPGETGRLIRSKAAGGNRSEATLEFFLIA